MQQRPASTFAKISESACAAIVSLIHHRRARHAIDTFATLRRRPESSVVDSESQILATKKF
jgi:hypothetical protein